MKKHLLLSLSIATITTNSSAIFKNLRNKLKNISFKNKSLNINKPVNTNNEDMVMTKAYATLFKDYLTIYNSIPTKLENLNHYKKPSEFLNPLIQNKSINTEYISPSMIFHQEDINFLDKQFNEISKQNGSESAWLDILRLIRIQLDTIKELQENIIYQATPNPSNNAYLLNKEETKNIIKEIENHKKIIFEENYNNIKIFITAQRSKKNKNKE